jgi:hypothetical protein
VHGGRRRAGLDELKNLLFAVVLVVLVGYFVWRAVPPAERPSLHDPTGAIVTVVPPLSPGSGTGG